MRTPAFVAIAMALSIGLVITSHDAPRAAEFNGRDVFRFDTFGDEQLWTDVLHMEQVLPGVSPEAALKVGLKVDADALPSSVVHALKTQQIELTDPAVTIQLLALNAVVGVTGKVNNGTLESVGITCALCHSSVDDSLADGVGRRLDGWPNRDLNVGAIVSLSTAVSDAEREILGDWGPGFYDPRLRAFNGTMFIPLHPDSEPVLIPPAYGLRDVVHETYTGDGSISYWNSYVGVTQMGGQGTFNDPRIPLFVPQSPDLVTPKLPALLDYQLKLQAPNPPPGSFNQQAAKRGQAVFNGPARCAECHSGKRHTDVASGPIPGMPLLHAPAETGMDATYADRTVNKQYRTTPLAGVWHRAPYFHDGSADTLLDVVDHYDSVLQGVNLTPTQKADLVEYLKSL